MDFVSVIRGILGLMLITGIAFLLSNNKRRINWRLVIAGFGLQIIFAVLILKGEALRNFFSPLGWPKDFFHWASYLFVLIIDFTSAGSKFVFGEPLALHPPDPKSLGVFFAFQVLPTIIFFASLMSILYYLGIMQKIVKGMAWVMHKAMGTSGAESLSVAADIFVGQSEAPLVIRPFLKGLTKSELLTIMVGGMATIAGGVMISYIQILGNSYAQTFNIPLDQAKHLFATHLLSASVMAAPAALVMAKVMFPETEVPETKGTIHIRIEKNASNIVEAAAVGAGDGLNLALNVGAMLVAFIALIAMANYFLQWIGDIISLNQILKDKYGQPLNFQLLIGLPLQYLAAGIGVPWQDSFEFGSLIGTKVVLNEFVAYLDMGALISKNQFLNEKSIVMTTYALCGFANFGSIAIQIGGIGPLAPSRKPDIASLGIKSLIGGSLATLATAALAGILY